MKKYKGFTYPESLEEAVNDFTCIREWNNPQVPYIMIQGEDIIINTTYTRDDILAKTISYENLEKTCKDLIDDFSEGREKRKARE